MAKVRCLNHVPTEEFSRNFVNTLPYEEDHCCEVARCAGKPVIWLNPEEVRLHERGTRLFQNYDFDTLETQDAQLSQYRVNPISVFVSMLKRQFLIQNQQVQSDTQSDLNGKVLKSKTIVFE